MLLLLCFATLAASWLGAASNPLLGPLPQLCGGCILAPGNPLSVVPGPCVSLSTRSLCVLNNSILGCPPLFAMCPPMEWMPMPAQGAPVPAVSMSLTNTSIQVSMGGTVIFYMHNQTRNFSVCSSSPNTSSSPQRGDGLFFSGVLNPTQKFWFTFVRQGRFRYYDCYRPEYFGFVVVRPATQPAPLTFFIPIRYNELTPGALAHITSLVGIKVEEIIGAVPNGTLVFNVSLSESTRGGVRISVQFDTTEEFSVVNNFIANMSVNVSDVVYSASTTDDISTTETGPGASTTTPITESVAGGGGGVLLIIAAIYMLKRRRLSERPLKMDRFERDAELAEHEATQMHDFNPLLDHRGFAEIHYSIVKGETDHVRSLLQGDASPDSGVSPASGSTVTGSDTSPWSTSPLSEPQSRMHASGTAWVSPESASTEFAAVPSPHATVLNTYGIRLVDLPDSRGNTPLIWAVRLGDIDMCRLFCEHGCNLAAQNEMGQSALHFACVSGALEILNVLLTAGAPVDAQDNNGATPLWHLCMYDRHELVSVLLSAGCNPNTPDHQGMTPLMVAVSRGQTECLRLLLSEPTIQLPDKDIQGWSALHWAVAVGERECLRWLLSHRRVRIAVTNNKGETPLHMAAREGNIQIVELLLNGRKREVLRVVLPATTNDGLSALDYARSRHRDDVVALLEELCALHLPARGAQGEESVAPGAVVSPTTTTPAAAPAAAAAAIDGASEGQAEGDSGVDDFAALDEFDPVLLAELAAVDQSATFSFPFDSSTSRSSVGHALSGSTSVSQSRIKVAPAPDETPAELNRRQHKREYMRDRRREQREEEHQWEEKVAQLDDANKQLEHELRMLRAEAAGLRSQLTARTDKHFDPHTLIAVTPMI